MFPFYSNCSRTAPVCSAGARARRRPRVWAAAAFTLFFALVLGGCDSLDVENENAPNREQAISSPADIKSVLGGGYASWWGGTYEQNEPAVHLDGWADSETTTNAFEGYWDATNEPRIQINNTSAYANKLIMTTPWQSLNAAFSSANDVINAIENNELEVVIEGDDQTQMVLAGAYFLRGLTQGYLANMFDQAYIIPADYDPENDPRPPLSPYPEVLDAAVSDLDRTISISGSNEFVLDNFLPFQGGAGPDPSVAGLDSPVPVTQDRLAAIASSFAARFIVSNSRTASENASVDWGQIQSYAENGIDSDFILVMDNNPWFNNYTYLSGLFWYFRVDNRIMNLMSEEYPKKYPADQAGNALARISLEDTTGAQYLTEDARLDSDFSYTSDQSYFRIQRGAELQSNYFYTRYGYQWFENPVANGPEPILLEAENALLLAEAQLQQGDLSEAISIVNDGSRVERGELDPLPGNASQEDVVNAIFYERDIELMRSGTGLAFFDMRRRDALQAGTPLHLPVPADELTTIGESLYTFGGEGNAGQEGTASGSNSWTDEGNNPPGYGN